MLILTVGFPVTAGSFPRWTCCIQFVNADIDWPPRPRLSAVLVSHFLLDLQEAHQKIVVGLSTGDLSNISQNVDSIQFNAGALGSVGATVGLPTDPVQEEEEDEEDEGSHVGCDDHRTTTEPAHLDEGDP
uniref:Zn(2)-C6 fungal-type domain-containing protein n=1 Tax=Ganoderma boninense TaxID=34458 RepID=A0A5K1K5V9_9APHY|nr:Zn(2)-C6 fungal-type domain-containing protein [Ganoderma boninense]